MDDDVMDQQKYAVHPPPSPPFIFSLTHSVRSHGPSRSPRLRRILSIPQPLPL
jgi:hypothetical protein